MKSTTEKQKKINLRVCLLAVSNLMLIIFISVLITPPTVTAGGAISAGAGDQFVLQGERRMVAYVADKFRTKRCVVVNKTAFYFHERIEAIAKTMKDKNGKDLFSHDPNLVKQEILHVDTQLFKLYPQYRFGLYRDLSKGKFLRTTMDLASEVFFVFSKNLQDKIWDISTQSKPDRISKRVLFQRIPKIMKSCEGNGRHAFRVWDEKHG